MQAKEDLTETLKTVVKAFEDINECWYGRLRLNTLGLLCIAAVQRDVTFSSPATSSGSPTLLSELSERAACSTISCTVDAAFAVIVVRRTLVSR